MCLSGRKFGRCCSLILLATGICLITIGALLLLYELKSIKVVEGKNCFVLVPFVKCELALAIAVSALSSGFLLLLCTFYCCLVSRDREKDDGGGSDLERENGCFIQLKEDVQDSCYRERSLSHRPSFAATSVATVLSRVRASTCSSVGVAMPCQTSSEIFKSLNGFVEDEEIRVLKGVVFPRLEKKKDKHVPIRPAARFWRLRHYEFDIDIEKRYYRIGGEVKEYEECVRTGRVQYRASGRKVNRKVNSGAKLHSLLLFADWPLACDFGACSYRGADGRRYKYVSKNGDRFFRGPDGKLAMLTKFLPLAPTHPEVRSWQKHGYLLGAIAPVGDGDDLGSDLRSHSSGALSLRRSVLWNRSNRRSVKKPHYKIDPRDPYFNALNLDWRPSSSSQLGSASGRSIGKTQRVSGILLNPPKLAKSVESTEFRRGLDSFAKWIL